MVAAGSNSLTLILTPEENHLDNDQLFSSGVFPVGTTIYSITGKRETALVLTFSLNEIPSADRSFLFQLAGAEPLISLHKLKM